ncbi:MAG: hypothetical protein IT529_00735 [Burkholderiales bacterium]|nr:hypothetical protein [Burkholderiales bacterium]
MAGMHALHKIMANRARPRPGTVVPGEHLEIEPDIFGVIVAVNGAEAKRMEADLEELGIGEVPLRERIFAIADHAFPARTVAIAAAQKLWRDFFRRHGIRTFDGGAGVSHLVLCEQGIVRPGMLAIAIDSHAPTMGAIGMYAASLGGGRLTLYAIGRHVMQVPEVTLVRVSGGLAPGVLGRDASLYVNGKLGQRGAYGNAVEFAGSFIEGLSMDMRFTFANMGTEMGAVTSYIQPDRVTLEWVDQRGGGPYTVYETDPGFEYDGVHEIDVSGIAPQIAVPHAPDDVRPVAEVAGRRVDQAYIGSCASGRLEDMAAAARVLSGRKVHPDVRLVVTPGSREVLKAASALGYIQTMHEANAIVTSANCGACPGLHGGILAAGEVAITSITRNFEGAWGRAPKSISPRRRPWRPRRSKGGSRARSPISEGGAAGEARRQGLEVRAGRHQYRLDPQADVQPPAAAGAGQVLHGSARSRVRLEGEAGRFHRRRRLLRLRVVDPGALFDRRARHPGRRRGVIRAALLLELRRRRVVADRLSRHPRPRRDGRQDGDRHGYVRGEESAHGRNAAGAGAAGNVSRHDPRGRGEAVSQGAARAGARIVNAFRRAMVVAAAGIGPQ